MRIKTKIFFASLGAIALLWLAAFWLIQNVVRGRIDQMAREAFEGTKQSLAGLERSRVGRMQQAGQLVMNIPELRALIAEQNFEISDENRASLKERLDHLEHVVGASFICVLDRNRRVIAQSATAPWATSEAMNSFCRDASEPAALIQRVFSNAGSIEHASDSTGRAEYGLWPCAGRIYHVVAIPLIFETDGGATQADIDGALVLAKQINDDAATELAHSHNAQVTFLEDNKIVASSLPAALRNALLAQFRASAWPTSKVFVFQFDGILLHGVIETLRDPHSGSVVSQMLIQRDEQDAAISRSLLVNLMLIMAGGVLLAGAGSFILSSAITRPVEDLVAGAQKVAQGDLNLAIPVKRKDELGRLATSFNDMVQQLRSRSELERQVQKAESASRAKGQFLANMSHEIRTPLNGVIGMTELLLGTGLTEQQRRYAALVKTSGELLTSLINDILDFSKIEAGKLEFESVDFDLYETVDEVIALLSERAAKKKLELACHFHRDVPRPVRGDPDRLRQILVNLVNNAIKFTASGSVVVSVTADAIVEGHSPVRFAVTDTGIGVAPDRLDRLFKPFSQVDASTTRKYGGTGLGLAIVKQLAELMGGSVGVESVPLKGSTFWFSVKLQPRPACDSHRRAGFDPEQMRVLAVDDSQTSRSILQQQLESWGVRAMTVGSAGDALRELRAGVDAGKPFRIVIIDSDMPVTSGFELARQIKADPRLSRAVLVALLPLEMLTDSKQLRDIGFAGHMVKPVRQSQLFDGLMRAVAREHAQEIRGPESVTKSSATSTDRGKILVAEDNEVNQIVVTELLARAGYECHIVDSGRKTIDQAISGKFDLVLMDCQMPEMDGFEATRLIRQGERAENRRHIPIVALTANAMKGDREQCLEAGMDGYCAKPVNARQLIETIASLLRDRTPAPASPTPGPGTPTQKQLLPAIVIDTLLERCTNNAAVVDKVIGKFEQQAQRELNELTQQLAVNDILAVARIAHALKGAASIVAANQVAATAAAIEQLARTQQGDQIEQKLAQLRNEIARSIEYLPHVRAIAAERLTARAQRSEANA